MLRMCGGSMMHNKKFIVINRLSMMVWFYFLHCVAFFAEVLCRELFAICKATDVWTGVWFSSVVCGKNKLLHCSGLASYSISCWEMYFDFCFSCLTNFEEHGKSLGSQPWINSSHLLPVWCTGKKLAKKKKKKKHQLLFCGENIQRTMSGWQICSQVQSSRPLQWTFKTRGMNSLCRRSPKFMILFCANSLPAGFTAANCAGGWFLHWFGVYGWELYKNVFSPLGRSASWRTPQLTPEPPPLIPDPWPWHDMIMGRIWGCHVMVSRDAGGRSACTLTKRTCLWPLFEGITGK